jgi:hypothetical protein
MAKAQIITPDGTQIKLDGTPGDIAQVLRDLKGTMSPGPTSTKTTTHPKQKNSKVQLVDLLASLIDGGFFKQPRDLASIKAALAEMGHHYPVTTLSPTMLRKVRTRALRRIKEQKRWMYVR